MLKTILLVDDDLDLQDIIKNALEIEGYNVLIANNGREALDVLEAQQENNQVNCIILDLMMPIMDGAEMLGLLRKNPKLASIPVIISTAKGTVDPNTASNSQSVIKKPMKIDLLYSAIEKYSKQTH